MRVAVVPALIASTPEAGLSAVRDRSVLPRNRAAEAGVPSVPGWSAAQIGVSVLVSATSSAAAVPSRNVPIYVRLPTAPA